MTKKNLARATVAASLFLLVIATAALNSDKNTLAATGKALSVKNAALMGENDRFVAINHATNERAVKAEARAKTQANRIVARAQAKLDKRAAALRSREATVNAQARRLDARTADLDVRARELDGREAAVTALEEEFSIPEEEAYGDGGGDGCHPSYEGACLDPSEYDYDCEGGSGDGPGYTGYVTVVGPDEYDLDGDGDGQGCE